VENSRWSKLGGGLQVCSNIYVSLRLGGKLVVNFYFHHFFFFDWHVVNFQNGIKAWLLLREGKIEVVFFTILKSFEILGVFCFLNILSKSFKALCVFFVTFFYSQSWHPLLMFKVLTNWMAIIFIHGRWRWIFSYMRKICGKSLENTYCHL
jgi:hypothetical protein